MSSGPDGEFLFAVNHAADISLRDLIPGLPSFQARVTGSSDGILNVTARDQATNREQKVTITASSGLTEDDHRIQRPH